MFDLQNVCQMMRLMGEGVVSCYATTYGWRTLIDCIIEMQTIMRAFAEFSFILISVMLLTEIVGI